MKKVVLLFASILFSVLLRAQTSYTVASSAGNLSSLVSSYATTVTNLTVTGTIDARDFVILRTMATSNVLSVIDLSGATIDAYTGPAGPVFTNWAYNAN